MEDKAILELYKVDYTDPTNFIYVINNKKIDDYKIVNGNWNYNGLLKLYMKFFNKKNIECEEDITSFPIYPNMTHFDVRDNQLTSFPIQPNI